jgi:hypothetical protein
MSVRRTYSTAILLRSADREMPASSLRRSSALRSSFGARQEAGTSPLRPRAFSVCEDRPIVRAVDGHTGRTGSGRSGGMSKVKVVMLVFSEYQ